MKRMGLILVVLTLFGAGVVSQQKAGGDEAAIAKIRASYQTAAAAQDGAALAKLYATDGEEMPPNAPAVKGRAAIEKYHKDFATQFMVHALTVTSSTTHVSGAWASDVGTYKQQLMAMKTGTVIDDQGKYVVVLKKDSAGNWSIAHLIYNSDLPPPPAPTAKK